jgi:uncharacterized membrane protein
MTSSRNALIVATACLLALTPAALAGAQSFTTIDYPGAGATSALGINPAGDIVGGYSNGCCDEHGYLMRHGAFTSYDYPGAAWTEFEAITPQGDILGEYGLDDYSIHSFVLRKGIPYSVDVLGQPTDVGIPNTVAVHINPEGTIVGCYHQSDADGNYLMSTMYGYAMKADGSVESFDVAPSMHNGVNPAGDVVGIYYNAAGTVPQSYLIHNGVVSWFSFPGSKATQAWDISPTGAIVGFHRDATGFHGFVMDQGVMTSLDVPGSIQTKAFGINAGGDIVGYYIDSTLSTHGFLLSHHAEK